MSFSRLRWRRGGIAITGVQDTGQLPVMEDKLPQSSGTMSQLGTECDRAGNVNEGTFIKSPTAK